MILRSDARISRATDPHTGELSGVGVRVLYACCVGGNSPTPLLVICNHEISLETDSNSGIEQKNPPTPTFRIALSSTPPFRLLPVLNLLHVPNFHQLSNRHVQFLHLGPRILPHPHKHREHGALEDEYLGADLELLFSQDVHDLLLVRQVEGGELATGALADLGAVRGGLGGEEGLELVVEDDAEVFGQDVVVVAVPDDDAEGVGGADALGYEALFVADLQGMHVSTCSLYPDMEVGGGHTVGAISCRRWKNTITSCWASNLRTKCVYTAGARYPTLSKKMPTPSSFPLTRSSVPANINGNPS